MTTNDFIAQAYGPLPLEGSVTWKTPSNIALVKYWGKRNPQLPENPSISFTLDNCHTLTTVAYQKKEVADSGFSFDIFFEGVLNEAFKPKIEKFLERIQDYVSFVKDYHFTITSENSFPHSSGIASSASGMSALSMCLMSIEKELLPDMESAYFYQKGSFLARLGSGSACRSVKGRLVVWGEHPEISESSDLYGVPFIDEIAPVFFDYQDTILLVDKGEKQVSSTVGHDLMHKHPFATQRFQQANENLAIISDILQQGDIDLFINLVESEALSLHAMMLTSSPYFILMKPNTLEIINAIWRFRKDTGSKICFTLDAGANVHVLYPENESKKVLKFVNNKLSKFCQKNQYICDSVGLGAVKL